ncbi:MAG: ribosome biogenesis GTP-binding protein YihA/YsxC [Bacilli bacterium]
MIIKNVDFVTSVASKDKYLDSDKSEILLLGRSNVGKSSFINMILNRKNIAHISSRPGKTQTLNFYNINDHFHLVDAPGYGFAKVNKKVREKFGVMIEDYLTLRSNLKLVMLLVDSRHDPTNDDILMYEYLMYYDIPTVIIVTKTDKLSNNKLLQKLKKIKEVFACKVIPVSSITNLGREDVYLTINDYL